MTDKEAQKIVPKIMVDYLTSLAKSNTDWEMAMREAISRISNREMKN